MSKRNRQKRRHIGNIGIIPTILQTLRADFSCNEEEIELIQEALKKRVPYEIAQYMQDIHEGKVPFLVRQPLHLDMGDGTTQEIQMRNDPHILILDYLEEKFNKRFALLYWHAITSTTPQDFYDGFKIFKSMPLTNKILQGGDPDIYSPEWIATHAKVAMDYLAPLVRSQNMPPGAAIVLAAGIMDRNITGKERYISEDDLLKICEMIMAAWEQKLFAPNENYPYTFEQTAQDWQDNDKDIDGK
jgi:hypothetical protein